MTKKRVLLSQTIRTKPTPPAPVQAAAEVVPLRATDPDRTPPPKKGQAPSRIGTRMLAFHVPDPVSRQFKVLAAEQGRSVQAMLQEAVNDLFRKYDKETIA